MNKSMKGSMLLFFAALIWGSSFIVMKSAVDFLTPAVLLFVRFTLASLFLSLLFFNKLKVFPKDKIKGGFLTGCCLFSAYYVQTWGLNFTTPGKNAFLTAVYCAIVPFLVWIFYKKRPDIYNFIAGFLCVIGIGFVSLSGDLTMNTGDLLTLCGGVLYALHILMVKKYSEDVDGIAFTVFQFIGGAIVALCVALLSEDIRVVTQIQSSIFLQLFYLSFFATAVTLVCQTVGQKNTSECKASLILSLESVFGVLFSVVFYGEILTLKIVLGFVFIFVSIVLSETKLSFLKSKKVMASSIVVLLMVMGIQPAYAGSSLSLDSPYAYIYNLSTDQIIYEKNADSKIYPASMTKVMTALVALENIKDLNEVVSMDQYDFEGLWEAGASMANLEVGEKVTYLDLIYGIILPSGADACRATSRLLFGSEENMVKEMNKKAKELGLKNTHFENSTGLHADNHYTTVKEMGLITQTALKNKVFKDIFTTRSYRTSTTNKYMASSILKYYWRSHTGISHIKGCKTGYTDVSRSCLTSLVESQENDIVCVFAKCESSDVYVKDAKKVINYCDANYKSITPYKKGEYISTIQIKDGVKETYDIVVPSDIDLFMPKNVNQDDFRIEYKGETTIEAPTQVKSQLGEVIVLCKDEEVKKVTVTMNEEIEATLWAQFIRFIKKYFIELVIGIFVVIVSILLYLRYLSTKKRNQYFKYK